MASSTVVHETIELVQATGVGIAAGICDEQISRFPCEVLLYVHGGFDRAGPQNGGWHKTNEATGP